MSILKSIDLKGGIITFDDLSFLKVDQDLSNQINELKEDMLQIEYPDDVVLDIGWYPCFNIKGAFKVMVIKGANWNNPIYTSSAKDVDGLKTEIISAVNKAVS